MNYSITETENGWKRLSVTFEVQEKPKWWKFWETEIPKQKMTASFWVKADAAIPVMSPQVEHAKTK